MYTSTSTNFNNEIAKNSRSFTARLKTNSGSVINATIQELTSERVSSDGADVTIGSSFPQSIELKCKYSGSLADQNLNVDIGLKIGSNTEYVPLGKFDVIEHKSKDGYITLTAFDVLYTKGTIAYEPAEDMTYIAMCQDIASKLGTTFDQAASDMPGTLPAVGKITSATLQEAAGHLAGLIGCNAYIGRTGKLEFHAQKQANYNFGDNRITDIDLSELRELGVYIVEGKGDEYYEYVKTSGKGKVLVSNPLCTDAETLAKTVANYWQSYYGGTVAFALGDPRLDPWDFITYKDKNNVSYKIACNSIKLDFDGGLSMDIESHAKNSKTEEIEDRVNNPRLDKIEEDVEEAGETAEEAYDIATTLEEILGRIAKLEEDDEGGDPNWNIVAFNKNVREYKNCIVIGYGAYNLDISEGPYVLDRCTLIGGTFKTNAITGAETKPMFALKTRATVIGARFEANSRDKYPAIFEENRTKIANGTVKVPDYVTLSGTSSNINAFWIGEYNNITIQDCYFNNVIPARINGAKGLRIINNRIMNAPMVVWASNANMHFGGNHVTIPSDCPTYFYHIYYLSNETICHAFNNDVTMNSSDGHYLWSIYHLMTAGDTSTTQELYDTGSIYRGSFNHITDSRYSRMFMNGCDYRNCMNTMSCNGQHLNIEFDCCNFSKLNGVAREAGTDRTDAKHRFVNCEINAPNELPAYCEYKNCYIKSTGAHDMLLYNNTDIYNSRFLISGALKRLFVISSANVSAQIVGNHFKFNTRNSDGGGLIRCNNFTGCATFNTVTGANTSSNAMVQATTSAENVNYNTINGVAVN